MLTPRPRHVKAGFLKQAFEFSEAQFFHVVRILAPGPGNVRCRDDKHPAWPKHSPGLPCEPRRIDQVLNCLKRDYDVTRPARHWKCVSIRADCNHAITRTSES